MSQSILNSIFLIAALCFAAPQIYGQKNLDVCKVSVTPWTWSTITPSWFEYTLGDNDIGKFPVDHASDYERTRESYRYDAVDKTFHVAAWINEKKKGKLPHIEIGLYVDESEPSVTGDYEKYIWAEAMLNSRAPSPSKTGA